MLLVCNTNFITFMHARINLPCRWRAGLDIFLKFYPGGFHVVLNQTVLPAIVQRFLNHCKFSGKIHVLAVCHFPFLAVAVSAWPLFEPLLLKLFFARPLSGMMKLTTGAMTAGASGLPLGSPTRKLRGG